jgi:hypothetical protein
MFCSTRYFYVLKGSKKLLKIMVEQNDEIFKSNSSNFIKFDYNCYFCDESCNMCSFYASNNHEFSNYFYNFLKKVKSYLKHQIKDDILNNFKINKEYSHECIKYTDDCCFCDDFCKFCSLYLKNINEFKNINEYSNYFNSFFSDVSEFVKNDRLKNSCPSGVCKIDFEDNSINNTNFYNDNSGNYFNKNFKNNFLVDYENKFGEEKFFKNFTFSNNEENSRLSKNFFGKKKLIFLIKKDIKKINFLERNFFFKIR